jgi:hypothetical protein
MRFRQLRNAQHLVSNDEDAVFMLARE